MANKYNLLDIPRLTGRNIFVDANVLIYLFYPTGSQGWEQSYATAYGKLLRQNSNLYVDFFVISEVINRTLKTVFESYRNSDKMLKYKQFRDSQDGRNTLSDIYLIVQNNILNQFEVAGQSFSKEDIKNFLIVDSLDFLDKGILKTCQEKNFVLFTNDKDFKDSNVDILTCNPAILRN